MNKSLCFKSNLSLCGLLYVCWVVDYGTEGSRCIHHCYSRLYGGVKLSHVH